jgi:hypothetical protein
MNMEQLVECELAGKTELLGRKPAPMSLCSPQIPHMTWDRTPGHGQDVRDAPKYVRLGILTVVTVKMTLFWDLTPYSLVDIYQRFGGVY